ncbi:hypothetical protein Avbf_07039 [Armadillidium vulgare]|nr:hypothetical protein Avbf_07039 [Armadillidium vulgare]
METTEDLKILFVIALNIGSLSSLKKAGDLNQQEPGIRNQKPGTRNQEPGFTSEITLLKWYLTCGCLLFVSEFSRPFVLGCPNPCSAQLSLDTWVRSLSGNDRLFVTFTSIIYKTSYDVKISLKALNFILFPNHSRFQRVLGVRGVRRILGIVLALFTVLTLILLTNNSKEDRSQTAQLFKQMTLKIMRDTEGKIFIEYLHQ